LGRNLIRNLGFSLFQMVALCLEAAFLSVFLALAKDIPRCGSGLNSDILHVLAPWRAVGVGPLKHLGGVGAHFL